VAEINALMRLFDRTAAILVAQNPSRGRTVKDGEYRIDGIPLHQTSFAQDPEYPATSSKVADLLKQPANSPITVGEASCVDDLRHWAAQIEPKTLPAGGADFFQAILEARGLRATRPFLTTLPPGPTLFVCGSTADASAKLLSEAVCLRVGDTSNLAHVVSDALRKRARAVIAIGKPIDRTPGAAQRLLTRLTSATANVLRNVPITNLLLEGGATASAVCREMRWSDFEIEGEFATGVVSMRVASPGGQRIIVKPGSYCWPDAVHSTSSA